MQKKEEKKVENNKVWKAGQLGAHGPSLDRANFSHGPVYQKLDHHNGKVGQLKAK